MQPRLVKPRYALVLAIVAVAALVAGALHARHRQLRPARELEAASAALEAAQALAAKLEPEPPASFESDVAMTLEKRIEGQATFDEAGVIQLEPGQPAFAWRVGTGSLIGSVAAVLRSEKLPPADEALRLGLERAFRGGRSSHAHAWGGGLEGDVVRARVLVAWRREERVLVLLATVRREVR